jgi:peptide-methionine (S)-S-oxide reductase
VSKKVFDQDVFFLVKFFLGGFAQLECDLCSMKSFCMQLLGWSFGLLPFTVSGCMPQPERSMSQQNSTITPHQLDTATFGAGCFWCVEAVFQRIKGVVSVASGYSGGTVKNPAYREVCAGTTGHAEVCQVVYDPSVVPYATLLSVFWQTHDPTTLNRQGNDVGTQYRSVIYYHNALQQEQAEKYKRELNANGAFAQPIVTEISPFVVFYKAEDYHQNYFNDNRSEGYCKFVIEPKVDKLEKVFKDLLKLAH